MRRSRKLLLRQRYSSGPCRYCGKRQGEGVKMTIEHLIPLVRGGTWEQWNLGCYCSQCNRMKGAMTEGEFLMWLSWQAQLREDNQRAKALARAQRRANR